MNNQKETSAPVAGGGVLDAMDDAAHALNSHPHARERDALLDARSTVAELIAAANAMLRIERTQGIPDEEAEAAVERLDAALLPFIGGSTNG